MPRSLEDFQGTFTIRHGSGSFRLPDGSPLIQKGFQLCIGTGQYNDPVSDGIRIGVSIIDPDKRQSVLPTEGNPPAFAYLAEGALNGSSFYLEGQMLGLGNKPLLLSYQISMMTLASASDGVYRAPSIMVTVGDPQNAGVWGADDGAGG